MPSTKADEVKDLLAAIKAEDEDALHAAATVLITGLLLDINRIAIALEKLADTDRNASLDKLVLDLAKQAREAPKS